MKQRITLFLTLAILAISCKPDTEIAPGTTPLTVAVPDGFSNLPVPEDNPMTVEGVALGRMLFYEKRLSANNTMSCGSCHQQKFAFTDGGKAFSVGVDGMPGTRSTMSLANVAWFRNLMWDGRNKTLEEQAAGPIQNPVEMHQNLNRAVNKLQNTETYPRLFFNAFGSKVITEEKMQKAIAQFERTLISANSLYDQSKYGKYTLTADQDTGRMLFFQHPGFEGGVFKRGGNCGDCHGGSLLAKQLIVNNGLDADLTDMGLGAVNGNSFDNGKFKVPTLRNVALTGPYMHDGRFKTLGEVLDHYNEHVQKNSPNLAPDMFTNNNNTGGPNQQLGLTPKEKEQIVDFLRTLTDQEFVTDSRFSDPFAQTGMVK